MIQSEKETAVATADTLTPKDHLIRAIQDLPADSTYDEILQELALARMIERGLADSDAGRILSQEEMSAWVDSWDEPE